MGQPGDLLLIFADALVRSWKQIIKFRPDGSAEPTARPAPVAAPTPADRGVEEALVAAMEGVIRDERGLVMARESDD